MEKKRCGECIYLHKLRKDGVLCSENGKNKGCSSCKNWEPDIGNLSEGVEAIVELLGNCQASDVPILEWLLKKQEILLEKNSSLRIGRTVWHFVPSTTAGSQIYPNTIQNVTAKYAVGRDLQYGTCFLLPLDTKVFSSKEELLQDPVVKLKMLA